MIKDDHPQALLEVRGAAKRFAGVAALSGVDLSILPGEVHCVLGQNGAGKSTLIKMLAGVHQPDEGEILWHGRDVALPDPQSAIRLGIATMHQELDVVEGLTVAENVFLGHEIAQGGFTRRREAARRTRELLARLGHAGLSPHQEVGELSAANQQIVSMARALSHDIELMIMDEPSAVLDTEEVKNLFRVVRELTSAGIAVVYITHRLEEIREIGDRITVLKDGRSMASGLPVSETPTHELIRLMTGRAVENVFPEATPVPADAPVMLEVTDLALDGVFSEVSFTVRAGEVVGFAGLVGSGRSEILETVYGARRASAGAVAVGGAELPRGSVRAAVAAGVGLSPEERKSQGLVIEESVFLNMTLPSFGRYAKAGFLGIAEEREAASRQMAALELRPADPDRPAVTLSGGNQQKILLGRWLLHGTRVLLLDEPTRGVDVGARAEIYALIRELAAAGNAVVVVSSEIEEVLGLADTVLVIAEGEVLRTAPAASLTEHDVLDLVMEGTAA
ncbi:sugar ABC transporter ATP-binding protein [Leucobacter allii]|uniref:Sugar ABC transporter ATP-binding protein n=1 Tax=Leucobacter allii TaxID=2932247 RepID=A0ABY4FMJ9_9MICO|nr:sugar ABC transporter ATP-binding protein [Leucobacter allii]UOQ57502.1 sugar ABC transporter ATP-binding protein [Leucobacter allii]UOR01962.1 sugar ABC transporter ATP-binding protein [Leucobacter allii]